MPARLHGREVIDRVTAAGSPTVAYRDRRRRGFTAKRFSSTRVLDSVAPPSHELETRVYRFAFQCKHSEGALVDTAQRLAAHESLQRL